MDILSSFNYWAVIILMMIGFYIIHYMWNSFCNLKYMTILVLVFVPFFLLSCSSNIKKELGQVDELVFELTALEDSFLSVEKNKVDEAVKDYKYNMSRIKKYYHLDTVDRDFVQLMNSYKTIKKVLDIV